MFLLNILLLALLLLLRKEEKTSSTQYLAHGKFPGDLCILHLSLRPLKAWLGWDCRWEPTLLENKHSKRLRQMLQSHFCCVLLSKLKESVSLAQILWEGSYIPVLDGKGQGHIAKENVWWEILLQPFLENKISVDSVMAKHLTITEISKNWRLVK